MAEPVTLERGVVEPVTWERDVAGIRDQLHPISGREICCYWVSVCTYIVVVQHKSTKTSFVALAPDLGKLRQTLVLVPVCITFMPVQMGHSDKMPRLPKQ